MKKTNSEQANVNKQISNIVDAIASGFSQQSLMDKMSELEERQVQLESRIQELQANRQDMVVTEEMMRGLFGMYREAIKERNIPELKKFVDSYVQKVVVYRSHVEVTFRVKIPGTDQSGNSFEFQTKTPRKKLAKGSGVVA